MVSRPHPCLGWLHISPADTRRVMDRLLTERDAAADLRDRLHRQLDARELAS